MQATCSYTQVLVTHVPRWSEKCFDDLECWFMRVHTHALCCRRARAYICIHADTHESVFSSLHHTAARACMYTRVYIHTTIDNEQVRSEMHVCTCIYSYLVYVSYTYAMNEAFTSTLARILRTGRGYFKAESARARMRTMNTNACMHTCIRALYHS